MNSKLIPTGCFTASVLSLIISISKYISSGNSELLVGGVILTILLAIVGLRVLLKDRPSLFKGILALSLMILCGMRERLRRMEKKTASIEEKRCISASASGCFALRWEYVCYLCSKTYTRHFTAQAIP